MTGHRHSEIKSSLRGIMLIDSSPKLPRIAVLSVHTCPLAMLGGKKTGGMNVYVRDLAQELGRRGYQVDVFTRSQDDCVPRVMHDLGPNARVIHIPAGPEKPIPVAEVENYLDEFAEGVIAFARGWGLSYGLIHSHYWLSGLVAERLKRRWGGHIPIVQMFHTLGHMKNEIATTEAERVSPSRLDGESRIVRRVADALVAATPAEEEQLVRLYGADPAKISVIPPGVDFGRFHPIPQFEAKTRIGLDPAKQNILLAGRIEPLKGIDTLLEAVALVEECCHDLLKHVTVTIVGGDPWADDLDVEMARLQALRETLGITQFVTFVGSKDQMLLPNYYAASEMVVMPSHYESFGLVALEAMAMGTPVIASEVGGLAHLVRDGQTGFHVPARDARALSRKIYELLTDEPLRQQMGRRAREVALGYAWPIIAEEMMRLYDDLLQAKRLKLPFRFVQLHPHTVGGQAG